MIDINKVIEDLSINFRIAVGNGETELAKEINKKINQLIQYSTNIK